MRVVAFTSYEVTVAVDNGTRYVFAMGEIARRKLERMISKRMHGRAWSVCQQHRLIEKIESPQQGLLWT